METMTFAQIEQQAGLGDWRVVLGSLRTRFKTSDMSVGAAFVAQVVEAANAANHHPDLEMGYSHVAVDLTTHDAGGLTMLDVEMARTISRIAVDLGMTAHPERRQALEYAIDALDIDAIRPFWEAVTGMPADAYGNLLPGGPGMVPIWFQQMERPRPQRSRIHLDINVPREIAEARVAAAVDAGGVLLSDDAAPAFWVLADAEGNEACVCTAAGRD